MLFIKNKKLKAPELMWDQVIERKSVYRIDKATKMSIDSAQFSPNGCLCALLMKKQNQEEGFYLQIIDIRIASKQANDIDIYCLQIQNMKPIFSQDNRYYIATSTSPTIHQYLVFDLEEKRKSFIDHPIEPKVAEKMMMADDKNRLFVLRNKDIQIYCLINNQHLITIHDVRCERMVYLGIECIFSISQSHGFLHFSPMIPKKRRKLLCKASDVFFHNYIIGQVTQSFIKLSYYNLEKYFRKISKSNVEKIETTYIDNDLIVILRKYVKQKLYIRKICCLGCEEYREVYPNTDIQNQYRKSSSQGYLISKFSHELNFMFFT